MKAELVFWPTVLLLLPFWTPALLVSPMVLRDKLLATILGADTPAPAEPDVSTNPNSSGNWVTVAKFWLPSEVVDYLGHREPVGR